MGQVPQMEDNANWRIVKSNPMIDINCYKRSIRVVQTVTEDEHPRICLLDETNNSITYIELDTDAAFDKLWSLLSTIASESTNVKDSIGGK